MRNILGVEAKPFDESTYVREEPLEYFVDMAGIERQRPRKGMILTMDFCQSADPSKEKLPSSRARFTMVNQATIDLPEQVLIMIVSRVRDVRPATSEEDARSLCANVMHGIG